MFAAAAVCPHPPLLVPAVSADDADWLRELRAACQGVVDQILSADPDRIVVVGSSPTSRRWDGTVGGTLRPYGVDVRVGGAALELPLSLTIGCWLLDAGGWAGPRSYVGVAPTAAPDECAAIGADLASSEDRVALLVMGDGSAKRTTESPGYFDRRATAYDAAVADALAAADDDALMKIDPDLSAELWAAGRPAWQVLAGARRAVNGPLDAHVSYDAAPRGVGYMLATWVPR